MQGMMADKAFINSNSNTHPLLKPQFVEPPVDHHLLPFFRDEFGILQTVQIEQTENIRSAILVNNALSIQNKGRGVLIIKIHHYRL